MDQQKIAPEMSAITISRQYGSGGGEIAARLAQRLDWQLIDHEIVAQVAHSLGITEEEAEVHDERVQSLIERALNALTAAAPLVPPPLPLTGNAEVLYNDALRQVVECRDARDSTKRRRRCVSSSRIAIVSATCNRNLAATSMIHCSTTL